MPSTLRSFVRAKHAAATARATPDARRRAQRHRRRRTLGAVISGSLLAGAFSFAAIDALAQESEPTAAEDVDPFAGNPDFAAGRLASFARQADDLQQDRLDWLDVELREFVRSLTIEGITPERRELWGRLADCESGNWHHGVPLEGTRRWDYGLVFDHGDIFEGGLNFHPGTWDAFRDPDMPGHAGEASDIDQMLVGERVLAAQGWRAWPVCSRKLGLR